MANPDRFAESTGLVQGSAEDIFAFLDDQSNLSAHMSQSSGMMLGARMDIIMPTDRTRKVGSRFGFTGSVLGIPLAVDEVVTAREPPHRKTWETTVEPRLWVIGAYRMGFELSKAGTATTTLRVYIHYRNPVYGIGRLLGPLLGSFYARWCTAKMVSDARAHFAHQVGNAPSGSVA